MTAPSTEKVAVAGLARFAGAFFFSCGAIAATKGVWDFAWGRPEARFFSVRPWSIVTQPQWTRFAGFELAFGLVCLGLGWVAWRLSRRLPPWTERR